MQTFEVRSWWSLCLPIGAFCMSRFCPLWMFNALTEGLLSLRRRLCLADYFSLNDENLDSLMLYILTQLVIICSPAAFLAFNYILYGRLLADNVRPEYSMMRPATVSKVFIISDVSTFFLQVRLKCLVVWDQHEAESNIYVCIGFRWWHDCDGENG